MLSIWEGFEDSVNNFISSIFTDGSVIDIVNYYSTYFTNIDLSKTVNKENESNLYILLGDVDEETLF